MPYHSGVQWSLPFELPKETRDVTLSDIDYSLLSKLGIKVVFSALPSKIAASVEPELRDRGFAVFSNASAMRYNENVPILIPEINSGEIDLIINQGYPKRGFIITNANCSTTGLAVSLAPLKKFGIKRIIVSTYQALSGAGLNGLNSPELRCNALPWIEGEEKKITKELTKILRTEAKIISFCVRIDVPYGHLETVWVEFDTKPDSADILQAWNDFTFKEFDLPSLPHKPVQYLAPPTYPQPSMSFEGNPPGMQVFTGRLKKENDLTGFVLLSNNLVKGAAGGSIENAELFIRKYGENI
jgi:aspartate-semialdehyde dehydrogenase